MIFVYYLVFSFRKIIKQTTKQLVKHEHNLQKKRILLVENQEGKKQIFRENKLSRMALFEIFCENKLSRLAVTMDVFLEDTRRIESESAEKIAKFRK